MGFRVMCYPQEGDNFGYFSIDMALVLIVGIQHPIVAIQNKNMCLLYYFHRLLNDTYFGNVKLMDFPAIQSLRPPAAVKYKTKTTQDKAFNNVTRVCYYTTVKKLLIWILKCRREYICH